MSWQPDWPVAGRSSPPPDVDALIQRADHLSAAADSRERLLAAMEAWERLLEQDPTYVRGLTELANQSILMGTAHAAGRDAKRDRFRFAMRLCERAMYTNPEFKNLADRGQAPWEACGVLDPRDMPAMMFWSTAVLYLFKEGLTFPEQVLNLSWVERTGPFLKRMEALDPTWGGGAIQFSQSLYYGILPGVLGGDEALSQQYLEAAVGFGSPWMLSRWGRARYFHVRDQDRTGFEADLRWVLGQDVRGPGETYCWRVYFHQDARAALADADRYFP